MHLPADAQLALNDCMRTCERRVHIAFNDLERLVQHLRSPGADVAGVGPVVLYIWQGWAQVLCRCGRGGAQSRCRRGRATHEFAAIASSIVRTCGRMSYST